MLTGEFRLDGQPGIDFIGVVALPPEFIARDSALRHTAHKISLSEQIPPSALR